MEIATLQSRRGLNGESEKTNGERIAKNEQVCVLLIADFYNK